MANSCGPMVDRLSVNISLIKSMEQACLDGVMAVFTMAVGSMGIRWIEGG